MEQGLEALPAGGTVAMDAMPDVSLEAIAARILARNRARIRVKNEEVAAARLGRIVETALALANESGFHGMSLRDLSEHSGLSMGALYAYFDSKETLLLMMLDLVTAMVDEVLGQIPEGLEDPRARLRWALRAHVRLTEALLPWFSFAFLEAKAFPPKARAVAVAAERQTEGQIAAILAEGAERGVFQVADPEMAAALIKPMLQDWYVKRSKYRRRGVTPDGFADALIGFVERALAPERAE